MGRVRPRWTGLRNELLPHGRRRRSAAQGAGSRPALHRRLSATSHRRLPGRSGDEEMNARAYTDVWWSYTAAAGRNADDPEPCRVQPGLRPHATAYGSLLHAHLRNVLYAKATFQPPTTFCGGSLWAKKRRNVRPRRRASK